MASYAVRVTDLNSHHKDTKQGILASSPQVGKNLLIYLGGQQYITICQVKGWIGPANSNYTVVFDKDGNRFRVEVFASSDQFL